VNPFEIAFHHAAPHGVLTAVHLPDSPAPVPEAVLAQLHPEESQHARTLGGYRQVQFVGGRLALAAARRQLGAPLDPSLPDDRGAPRIPAGFVASISHKRTIAVAMAARDTGARLGVDIEDYGPPRPGIAQHVLRPSELAELEGLPPDRHWIALLIHFSLKESIYKAIDPYVRRHVGFLEAEVNPDASGRAQVKMHLVNGEGPFAIDARYEWVNGHLLTSAQVRPAR
jgi:enterobactin synthetase component D